MAQSSEYTAYGPFPWNWVYGKILVKKEQAEHVLDLSQDVLAI